MGRFVYRYGVPIPEHCPVCHRDAKESIIEKDRAHAICSDGHKWPITHYEEYVTKPVSGRRAERDD